MDKFKLLGKACCVSLVVTAFHLLPFVQSAESQMMLWHYGFMFVLYAIVALQLQYIKKHIQAKKGVALVVIFMFFFVVDSLMSVLEGNFFIENYDLIHHLLIGLSKSILVVAMTFIMWKQEDNNVSLVVEGKAYLTSRSVISWLIRLCVVLLLSFIIYMIIGALAYPFTGPYMEATIKIPTIFENFMIQFLRGLGYLIVTLPIMILWKSKRSLKICLCISYILFYPILGYSFTHSLPLPLRLMDGLVLSLHLIAFTQLVMKLLSKRIVK